MNKIGQINKRSEPLLIDKIVYCLEDDLEIGSGNLIAPNSLDRQCHDCIAAELRRVLHLLADNDELLEVDQAVAVEIRREEQDVLQRLIGVFFRLHTLDETHELVEAEKRLTVRGD